MTEPEGLPTDVDWLLEMLATMADSGDFTVAVTLWTPGGIVAGDLVGGPVWVRELRRSIRANGDDEGRHFADDLQSVEDHLTASAGRAVTAVHLRNAATVLPSGEVFRHGLWRGRLSEITGWTLGKP